MYGSPEMDDLYLRPRSVYDVAMYLCMVSDKCKIKIIFDYMGTSKLLLPFFSRGKFIRREVTDVIVLPFCP